MDAPYRNREQIIIERLTLNFIKYYLLVHIYTKKFIILLYIWMYILDLNFIS